MARSPQLLSQEVLEKKVEGKEYSEKHLKEEILKCGITRTDCLLLNPFTADSAKSKPDKF